jgi:hypothetical protein
MNMESITQYLDKALQRNFAGDEYGDVVRNLYKLLAGMFQYEADTFTITPMQLAFSKDGAPISHWEFSRYKHAGVKPTSKGQRMSTIYREGMQVLLERDERVRQHVLLIEDTPEVVTYRLLYTPQTFTN